MKFHSLVKLGCYLLILQPGCVSRNSDSRAVVSDQVLENVEAMYTMDNQKLEIVALRAPDRSRVSIVLRRCEIAAIIPGGSGAITNGWANAELEQKDLFKFWLPTRSDQRRNRKFAEIRLAGCTVQKPYSLSELGVRDAQELLGKYFEPSSSALDTWWIKKSSPGAIRLREADLIATLKANGFQVAQGDPVPFLLVDPKSVGK